MIQSWDSSYLCVFGKEFAETNSNTSPVNVGDGDGDGEHNVLRRNWVTPKSSMELRIIRFLCYTRMNCDKNSPDRAYRLIRTVTFYV